MELALVVPIMLLLLLAAIDLGRIYYAQITVANAARAGAYEASTNKNYNYVAGAACASTNTVMCAVQHESSGSAVNIAPADVSMSCTPSCAATYGNKVGVTVVGHFSVITPLVWAFTGGSDITFASTAVADVVHVPGPIGVTAPVASFTATPTPGPPHSRSPSAIRRAVARRAGSGISATERRSLGRNPPAHTYALSGVYTITLTANNSTGSSMRDA